MSDDFDLVVIGSGPAGEKGAAQAAYFNKSVAIVEQAPTPGGIAVSTAGIPTKTLRETALYVSGFRQREVYGLGLTLDPQIALERLMTRESEVVNVMTRAVERNIARHGIEMIQGRARLGPRRSVRVSLADGRERVLRASAILIATGSHQILPAGVPFHDPDVYDPVEILKLDRIPGRLLVVGGGAVGCEYASIFAALGVEVTLMSPSSHLLRHLDAEICQMQEEVFNGMGIRLVLGAPIASVRRTEGELEVRTTTGQRFSPRRYCSPPAGPGTPRGWGSPRRVSPSANRATSWWTSGSRRRRRASTPPATSSGRPVSPRCRWSRLASPSATPLASTFKDMVDVLAPECVYSIPEVAMVGMTEAQAKAAGVDYETGRALFSANAKAKISGLHEGMVKLVFRRADRVLLGVHILGEMASELIHLGQLVLHEQAPIDRFIHATFAVPTRSEAYKYAAYDGLMRLDQARRRLGVLDASVVSS